MSNENQQVVWHAESTHPELASTTKEALRQVLDPELGLNIIELGLVRDLVIDDDKANISMIMTTPFCPYAPALLEMARKKAEETVKRSTTIEMGTEMWDPSMMEEGTGGDWGLF
jgi:metal-sulfur cluster biosynthetic enzyme